MPIIIPLVLLAGAVALGSGWLAFNAPLVPALAFGFLAVLAAGVVVILVAVAAVFREGW